MEPERQRSLPFLSEPERLIHGLNASERVKRVLLALHWLSETHGMKTSTGETMLDPTRDEIRVMMRTSLRTMHAAIEDAQAAGYLSSEPAAGRRNLYTIHWPTIFAEDSRQSANSDMNRKPVAASRRRIDIGENTGATKGCKGVQPRGAKGCSFLAGGVQAFSGCTPQNSAENRGVQPEGVHPSDLNELNELNIQIQEGSQTGGNGLRPRPRDWPTVTRAMLDDPKSLEQLFAIAVAAGQVHDDDACRVRFFATARYALGAKNAGGAFRRAVFPLEGGPPKFRWTPLCEDWARSVVHELHCRSPDQHVEQIAAARTLPAAMAQRTREQQQADLKRLQESRR